MIARGDPGVELPLERVLRIQKHIIQRATDAGVLVITHPRPTRAAASDVANAVLDRTDVVLRSGEMAVGQYPVAAVDTMVRIIIEAERQSPRAVSAVGREATMPTRSPVLRPRWRAIHLCDPSVRPCPRQQR